MENPEIARTFDELADLLELGGENPFKLRAYRNFAELARETGDRLADLAATGGSDALEKLDGVGPAIAKKVLDLLAKGTFDALDRARVEVPVSLLLVLGVPGLGAKTVRRLFVEAGIKTLEELEAACEQGTLAGMAGFGKKKQDKILEGVKFKLAAISGPKQLLLAQARAAVGEIAYLLGVEKAVALGKTRRGVELVEDVRMIASGITRDEALAKLEVAHDRPISHVMPAGDTELSASVEGISVAITLVPRAEWVHSALVGGADAEHVAWLVELAGSEEKLKELCAKVKSEEAAYIALGTAPVPAELREGRAPVVPDDLVALERLGGVFHVHSDWSDGTASILDMLRAARDHGLGFLGLSDHSQAAWYANGLGGDRLLEQAYAVEAARREVPEVRLFHGIEVDILADGALDLPDEILERLDFVIASVHSQLQMEAAAMTARLVRAVSHPLVTILGHPTGRLLLARGGSGFDVAQVAAAAAANDTFLEINANPQRLDLSDTLVRLARTKGARFAIDPDAHGTRGFADTALGVTVARRAALSAKDVLNAAKGEAVGEFLAARKSKGLAKLKASAGG
jgi:DNA polymerase (family 10)